MNSADWQSKISENARHYQELHDRLARLSISEASRDGAVRVTVSASGLLTGLELTETARPVSLADLAATVMDCVRLAQARIPDLLREAMSESVGNTDPNTHLLVADARQRFPEPAVSSPGQREWQPDEIRFDVPETSPAAASRRASTPARPKRVSEELWDEERPILKDV